MREQLRATSCLLLLCLLVTPATLKSLQERGVKGAKCKNPKVRTIYLYKYEYK